MSVALSPLFRYNSDVTADLELQNYIKKEIYDVVKPQWIKDSVRLGEPAPLHKK
jgi:DNA ligase-4